MKVSRALLLSSKMQAESYEVKEALGLFVISAPHTYRYLVTASGEGLQLQIFRIITEAYEDARKQQQTRRISAPAPHIDITFKDAGELINFLRRYEIDFKSNWQPVEE